MSTNRILNEINDLHQAGLKWCDESNKYIAVKIFPTVILRDGLIIVSTEDGEYFADSCGGAPVHMRWIHLRLIAIADKHNAYWKWESDVSISLNALGS